VAGSGLETGKWVCKGVGFRPTDPVGQQTLWDVVIGGKAYGSAIKWPRHSQKMGQEKIQEGAWLRGEKDLYSRETFVTIVRT